MENTFLSIGGWLWLVPPGEGEIAGTARTVMHLDASVFSLSDIVLTSFHLNYRMLFEKVFIDGGSETMARNQYRDQYIISLNNKVGMRFHWRLQTTVLSPVLNIS